MQHSGLGLLYQNSRWLSNTEGELGPNFGQVWLPKTQPALYRYG